MLASRSTTELFPCERARPDTHCRSERINHFASAQLERFFGYEPRELIGAPVELLMPERFQTGHKSLFKAYFLAPTPRPMDAGLRLYARRKDGRAGRRAGASG